MKTFSKHRLNFFERITDPMRFTKYETPPNEIIRFIWHFTRQTKAVIIIVFFLKFCEVIIDLSIPLVFGYIISRIIETGDVSMMLSEDYKFLIGFSLLFLIIRPLVQSMSQAFVNMSIMTGFANIVRWQSHLNVLGLDIGYFTNELSDIKSKLVHLVQQLAT